MEKCKIYSIEIYLWQIQNPISFEIANNFGNQIIRIFLRFLKIYGFIRGKNLNLNQLLSKKCEIHVINTQHLFIDLFVIKIVKI